MLKRPKYLSVLWISSTLTAIILSGCAGSTKRVLEDKSTMMEVYKEKFDSGKKVQLNDYSRKIEGGAKSLLGQSKTSYEKLSAVFPYLPNPVLVMYVFPHLTDAGTPIPAYSTFFKMYKSDEVALPGEVEIK